MKKWKIHEIRHYCRRRSYLKMNFCRHCHLISGVGTGLAPGAGASPYFTWVFKVCGYAITQADNYNWCPNLKHLPTLLYIHCIYVHVCIYIYYYTIYMCTEIIVLILMHTIHTYRHTLHWSRAPDPNTVLVHTKKVW